MNGEAYILEYQDGRRELVRCNMLTYIGDAAQFTFTKSDGTTNTTWTVRGYSTIEEVPDEHRFVLADAWRTEDHRSSPVKVRSGRKAAVVEIDSTP